MTQQTLSGVSLLVHDYDEAIAFYVDKLGFSLKQDIPLGDDKRWVVIAPPSATETALILAKASDAAQHAAVGNQAGGRVWLFLRTDNFDRDHQRYLAAGIHFEEAPRREAYGTVAVFQDLYGNRWDLIEITS